ncbi:MAG: hypothetical protein FD180_1022 [Planctomycetota bacterium]|nr:MAG: hypothetical protein FD180_1022 [Planctomycetota bacterium]
MRLALALTLIAALPALAEPGKGRFRSLEAWAEHGEPGVVRREGILLKSGPKGVELTLKVKNGCEVDDRDPVVITEAEWFAMDDFLHDRGILEWKEIPAAAPGWGSEGFAIEGAVSNSRSWTGPFAGYAPPVALQRRLARLAHAHFPEVPLEFFTARRGPPTRVIRAWTLAGGQVLAPKSGGPVREVEAEEWDDLRRVTVRQVENGAVTETVKELTAEAWDKLWAAASSKEVAAWDGKSDLLQTVGHGGGGLEVLGPDVRVELRWDAPNLPADSGVVGAVVKSLEPAAEKK